MEKKLESWQQEFDDTFTFQPYGKAVIEGTVLKLDNLRISSMPAVVPEQKFLPLTKENIIQFIRKVRAEAFEEGKSKGFWEAQQVRIENSGE